MASDEKNKPKKPDRKHLLEEIRRRAEQAELRRIEDEEQDVRKKKLADVPPERTAHDSIPVPVPTPDSPPPADQVARDQKLAVLRERLAIAIEGGPGSSGAGAAGCGCPGCGTGTPA
jgi:hypothetical protein